MTEAAERWMSFAREDLQMAELALASDIYNQVGFHSQQCVEKILKALIAAQGLTIPRTHAITDLLEKLPRGCVLDTKDDLSFLDDFYIPARYPDALPGVLPEGLPGKMEAEQALHMARLVMQEGTRMLAC